MFLTPQRSIFSQHLFEPLDPLYNQIDFMLRGLDTARRFLLKRMDHPDGISELHGIDNPEGIAL